MVKDDEFMKSLRNGVHYQSRERTSYLIFLEIFEVVVKLQSDEGSDIHFVHIELSCKK